MTPGGHQLLCLDRVPWRRAQLARMRRCSRTTSIAPSSIAVTDTVGALDSGPTRVVGHKVPVPSVTGLTPEESNPTAPLLRELRGHDLRESRVAPLRCCSRTARTSGSQVGHSTLATIQSSKNTRYLSFFCDFIPLICGNLVMNIAKTSRNPHFEGKMSPLRKNPERLRSHANGNTERGSHPTRCRSPGVGPGRSRCEEHVRQSDQADAVTRPRPVDPGPPTASDVPDTSTQVSPTGWPGTRFRDAERGERHFGTEIAGKPGDMIAAWFLG